MDDFILTLLTFLDALFLVIGYSIIAFFGLSGTLFAAYSAGRSLGSGESKAPEAIIFGICVFSLGVSIARFLEWIA